MRIHNHRARGLALVVVAAGVANCAPAPKPINLLHGWCSFKPPRVEIRLTSPEGSRIIDGEAAAHFYPDRANRMNKMGTAVVDCRYVSLKPSECTVVGVEDGYGFGSSAQRLAMKFPLPTARDGVVRVQARFVMFEPGLPEATIDCKDLPPGPPITDADEGPA